jgi:hypothetical protein
LNRFLVSTTVLACALASTPALAHELKLKINVYQPTSAAEAETTIRNTPVKRTTLEGPPGPGREVGIFLVDADRYGYADWFRHDVMKSTLLSISIDGSWEQTVQVNPGTNYILRTHRGYIVQDHGVDRRYLDCEEQLRFQASTAQHELAVDFICDSAPRLAPF